MKLQLALDIITMQEAIDLLKVLGNSIDIAEIGTPFVIQEGIKAVREIKSEFPSLIVLADLKIMDAGEHVSRMAFEAGADIVTVLGAADDATIRASVEQVKKYNKSIMVDMIGVKDIYIRAIEIDGMGVDYICVHTASDIQGTGKNSLDELKIVKNLVKNAETAVAGGIKLENICEIVKERPEIIIVGGGITSQPNKKQAAFELKKIMNQEVLY